MLNESLFISLPELLFMLWNGVVVRVNGTLAELNLETAVEDLSRQILLEI
jgi:hypothetical protein